MEFLYRFFWDYGRSGELEGLFIATEKEVQSAIGEYVYFGEVLGKFSEVEGTLKEEDFKKLEVSTESIAEISKHLGKTWSGFNPLNYIEICCEHCEDGNRKCDWNCEYREDFNQTLCDACYKELKDK